ncbi:formate dehydrogenase [Enteractinococcus helveticum]|nr:formate dehydrogenase [Enteractinococcus helveticum]
MANADLVWIQGSNMAEAHPVGFQWVAEAKARGAKLVHVDPRFTRTSAMADKHVHIRAGTDIALLGGLIRYMIENDLWFKEYVTHYSNAAHLVDEGFKDTEDLEGLFSGFDKDTGGYDKSTWQYEKDPYEADGIAKDMTLQHPRSVFQILRRHYSRYTPEMVSDITGIKTEDFLEIADLFAKNSGRERTTVMAYALGWTQHSMGSQFIRTSAILQLLMGNMGRPGGGIMALRGHATIQGSSDIPTLFNLLPGYLPFPVAGKHDTLRDYLDDSVPKHQKGFWSNGDAYMVSLLKAWFGDDATEENDFGYKYMPRLTGAHGTYQTLMRMFDKGVDGYFVLGQNPAVGSANGRMQRLGMSNLKWMVVRDFQLIETATWWKDGPEIATGELKTEDIATEVFFMPAANHTEKAGTFTQTQRLVQWRHQAITPPGDARSELEFFYDLGVRLKEKLKDSTDPRDKPLQAMTWDYPVDEHGEPSAEAVLKEINGYYTTGPNAGKPVDNFNQYKADGSTAGGCWIYAGVYAGGINHAANRVPGKDQDEMAHQWAWAWPANRRILYNRASADLDGNPWSERKKLVWWDEDQEVWTGRDIPDFPVNRPPSTKTAHDTYGPDALAGDDPFIMQSDGKGWLFTPKGMNDGPMPTHFEPAESPVENPLYPQQESPSRVLITAKGNQTAPSAGEPGSEVFPHIFTTYRLTEHQTAGGMSRFLPYLSELQPEMFVEVSEELAADVGLEPYGWATIASPRGAIEAKVLVTQRMKPVVAGGKTVHQIGMPFHFGVGNQALVTGDGVNDLLGMTLDPNVYIQSGKAVACTIMPGRRPRGPALVKFVEDLREQAGITPLTGHRRVTYERDPETMEVSDPPRLTEPEPHTGE